MWQIVKRDVFSKQFATSKNLGESQIMFWKRLFWMAVYFAKSIRWGFSAMRQPQLGSSVLCDGNPCFISNWAASPTPTLANHNGFYEERVAADRIQYQLNMRELWHRFKFGFSFYSSNWMSIDICNRLYPTEKVHA